MGEALQAFVKRVGELAEHVPGDEQATERSPVGPLFKLLGYGLTEPRECILECRVGFGPNRSVKPAGRKPVLDDTIKEWARQRTLTAAMGTPARSGPRTGGGALGGPRRAGRSSSPTRLRMGRGWPSEKPN